MSIFFKTFFPHPTPSINESHLSSANCHVGHFSIFTKKQEISPSCFLQFYLSIFQEFFLLMSIPRKIHSCRFEDGLNKTGAVHATGSFSAPLVRSSEKPECRLQDIFTGGKIRSRVKLGICPRIHTIWKDYTISIFSTISLETAVKTNLPQNFTIWFIQKWS